jgi:glycosyltransferase involved in cell wall biosynthesis
MKPTKKVLLVTYYFPPSGGAGVQRCLKFVKYLREFGWEPVVLTARDADYPAFDETLLREIPDGVAVYRSKIFEPYNFYRKLTGKKIGESMDIATLSRDSTQKRKLSERFAEWIRSWIFIPDARIGWKYFAVKMGREIIRKEKIDVILSSAPPYTCHLIGQALSRQSGRPWVCDFRDSWVGWLSAAKRSGLPHQIELKMEGRVLQHAHRILTVSPGVQEDLLSRHPELRDDRWLLLPNGYDASDFQNITPLPPDGPGKLTITYTGSLYGNRNPNYLFQAVRELLQEDPTWRDDLRFNFVGRVGQSIQNLLNDAEFAGMVQLIPYLAHQESIQYLLSADLLLLIIDDAPANRGILTGKLYEYLGARKPILALAPEGNAADLIRDVKAGFVVPPKNVAAIKQTLREIRIRWKNQSLETGLFDAEKIRALDRKALTAQLAQILNPLA